MTPWAPVDMTSGLVTPATMNARQEFTATPYGPDSLWHDAIDVNWVADRASCRRWPTREF
ncbi:hypothetical protein COMA2_30342 [Candidatus Nitrospira nitrificans]|uniref:Uncharacterized protein n=1 Tax=Candidatus Nitrospira nitrificans TaxID=1742973 RepID=A0A0S4LR51_9BACT|nr:hypothetical protein COMA2_30342 [Candidatus Nitrospira nitrificans]